MPKQARDQDQYSKDDFEDIDVAGDRGGDTGNSGYIDDGPQAEKGDARRNKPAQSDKAKNKDKNN